MHTNSQSISNQTFMNRNLTLFKIPAPALNEPGIPDYIDSLMKDILTKQRAMIKSKLGLSIKSKQHIFLLAKALAQSGYYEVTGSQWARFAFLRKCLVTFNELVMESMARAVEAMGSGWTGDTEGGNSAGDNSAGDNPAGNNPAGTSANLHFFWVIEINDKTDRPEWPNQ
ncbi:hypothetical protein JVT61DRAFT_1793 [Boletus reticuloceps]|uniref:Uncharacterized protein n=1 Tax=Boletus reticuloceps TaxID=495285 RepID=A0A8I2YRB5_9AGAM|nr:hypothetical protein JVT61DRAFT_1793 [Boletus reticuloceps]